MENVTIGLMVLYIYAYQVKNINITNVSFLGDKAKCNIFKVIDLVNCTIKNCKHYLIDLYDLYVVFIGIHVTQGCYFRFNYFFLSFLILFVSNYCSVYFIVVHMTV